MGDAAKRPPPDQEVAFSDLRLALICLAGGLLVGAGLSLAAWFALSEASAPRPLTHELVIPAGTADLISAGVAPPSIPASLVFREGDSLRIQNEDVVAHRVDSFVVGPGEAALFPLAPALDSGADRFLCTFHAAGSIQLAVNRPSSATSAAIPAVIIGLPLGLVGFVVTRIASRLG